MRVALYSRVSTEEQQRHGISIEAQTKALNDWAKENKHTIVGSYCDPGISARKAPTKRPDLQRLLQDIPEKKIELIAFTKLDRWTRNVKGYYQVQEILDKHHVAWTSVQEDYETVTSSGRFKVNIMLSVAENEADRTGERIKAVQAYKIAMGEAISGSLPIGLQVVNKIVVPDENAPAAREAFEMYAATGSKGGVQRMLREKYGIIRAYKNIDLMLRNQLYIGRMGDNHAFCQPLIPLELWNAVQDTLTRRKTKQSPTGHVYLFSGLVVCADCGRRMGGFHHDVYTYYRCPNRYNRHVCDNGVYFAEDEIERICLEQLAILLKSKKAAAPVKERPPVNKAAINSKLSRLKELYVEGDITKELYLNRKNELTAQLADVRPQKPSVLLGDDFLADYSRLSREQQKAFWRSVVDHVSINAKRDIDIFFSSSLY